MSKSDRIRAGKGRRGPKPKPPRPDKPKKKRKNPAADDYDFIGGMLGAFFRAFQQFAPPLHVRCEACKQEFIFYHQGPIPRLHCPNPNCPTNRDRQAPPSRRQAPAWTREQAALYLASHSGVPKDYILDGAEAREQAYRAAAKKLHPDHGGSHEEFLKLQQAVAFLRMGI